MGNIVAITVPIDGEKTYAYDLQGQLLQETVGDKTYTYTYDSVGNILSATKDGVAHTYTYGDDDWGDLLTAYDGNAITYDAIGNPLTYYNGQSWNFTWVNGRTLSQAVSGDTTVSYVYDKTNGMRLSKTVGEKTYEYYYADSKLLRMTVSDGTVMDFFYDHNGLPYAVKYNGTNYYYILNQQGDVVRLISADGTTVGTYQYDAWGNILSATDNDLTNANPLRYRGYVYDDETGFYYLSSRYYDPKIGRFVNADGLVSTGQGALGYNMFAYCNNSPVSYCDPTGCRSFECCPYGNCAYCKTKEDKAATRITLADFDNLDGTWSLYDSRRHLGPNNPFYEQAFWGGLQLPQEDAPMVVGKLGFYRGAGDYKYGRFDFSFAEAEAATGVSLSKGVGAYAKASLMTMQIAGKLNFQKGTLIIGLQGDYLSVGAGFYLDVTENGWSFTGGYSYGGGGNLILSWEQN